MGVVSMVAILSFICVVLVDKTDGDNMTLSSTAATVGQRVTLQCIYIGSYTPVTLNFYLGTDILGLQIDVSLCSFSSSIGYDITLYDKTCGVKTVNLTIKSVTEDDIGKTWQCDASFFTGPLVPPAKASTTIMKSSGPLTNPSTGLSTGAIVGIVIGIVVFLVHVLLICLIIRHHCCHGLSKETLIGITITSVIFVAVEVLLIHLIIKYCCNQNRDSSQSSEKTNNIENIELTGETQANKPLAVTHIKSTNNADMQTFDQNEHRPMRPGQLPSLTNNRKENVNQLLDGGQQNTEEPKKKKRKHKKVSQEDSEISGNKN